jgi:hypothetical protein
MASTVAPVETSVELSLVERIAKIEDSLKELKRCARQELKARRRRRGVRVNANGEKAAKGETPEQLKAWHEEVRKVWDEMRASDAKTPYKRAVAEASARRKGSAVAAPVAAVAPVAEKKVNKKAASASAAPVAVVVAAVETAAKKPRVAKKAVA